MRALIAAAMLTSLLLPQALLADPLHKSGKQGEWRHADSGWVFPSQIAGLKRVGRPYTIDGNNDVGAEYSTSEGTGRQSALVDIYLPDSAATGATLAGAKATHLKTGDAPTPAETSFPIPGKPEVKGVKISVVPEGSTDRQVLYFFTTPAWILSVRATVPAADARSNDSMDEFVRAMRWDTLGVLDADMHSGGS